LVKILSINKETPIQLIHAQDTGYAGLPAIIAGRILKIPVIISSHGVRHRTLASILRGRFGKILLKFEFYLDVFTLRHADSIIALNPEIKGYFENIVGKKVEFIPNSIKLQDFIFSTFNRSLIRKELGVDDQTQIIGFVGRLSPEKNLITLMDSFAEEVKNNLVLKLVFVGAGREELYLKEEARKNKIEDKVIFCGLRKDISRFYSAFDIFILPSYTEGLSSALLEAMACGCAIICSNIPGNQVLVTQNNDGLLVNPYDPQDIRQAIHLLSTDNFLRVKLGNNAKIKAEQYDVETVFPQVLQLYSRLIKRSS
jgi:glycosyltransferase involved in cell wall biosynthesis